MLGATTVAPCPRIRMVRPAPIALARSRPIATFSTRSAVSPNLSCESQIGTSWPILAHMCSSGWSLLAGDAERDHARRMVVHDRMHVRPRLVEAAMDEALEIGRLAARIDRLALERELHDVVLLDAVRRPRPRQEEALRIVGMPRADMAERVDHAFGREDAVGGDEFFEQSIELGHWRFLSVRRFVASCPALCRASTSCL